MTTIVYLHGFRSSPASEKARALVQYVDALPAASRPHLYVPDLATGPAADVAAVARWVEAHATKPLAFVGSSLGGFYATALAERFAARAVLVNPAVHPYDDLAPYLGPQTNLYTGRVFEVTRAHFDELRTLAVARPADPSRFLLYLQTGDEVLDWRVACGFHGGAWQCVEGGGDHGYQGFERHLATILRFAASGFASR